MGYISLQFDKVKGTSDTRMSEHIERKTMPSNADSSRTHLNRELIRFPEGVNNRNEAISHRIKTAGIKRKIADNQVRAIRILLSGTHEDLMQVVQEGKLDQWCEDNLQWLYNTYGEENTVSAVLHMDEKTPHIHATVIPIVKGERRKARKEKDTGKKKYRKKSSDNVRLCADDVLTREKLVAYHDSYARAMQPYGLERGIRGSEARHITTAQYYREVKRQTQELEQGLTRLTQKTADAEEKLEKVNKEIDTKRLEKVKTDTKTAIYSAVGSIFGKGKIEKLEEEKMQLTQDLEQKDKQIASIQREKVHADKQHVQRMNDLRSEYEMKIDILERSLEEVDRYFPYVRGLISIARECQEYGFSNEMVQQLVHFKPVPFKGGLYSKQHRRYIETDSATAKVEQISKDARKFRLCIDGMPILEWFKQQWNLIQEKMKATRMSDKPKRSKGIKF